MTIRPLTAAVLTLCLGRAEAQGEKPRARDLGVPFEGTPGPLNAITDVPGVEVGHTTLISGDSVRTGITVVLPEGKRGKNQVFAGWFTLNADGEMTGTTWIEESGILEGPVAITNTHSVGTVHQAVIEWSVRNVEGLIWSLPVVAETWDGGLNDINGFHVKPEHVFAAVDGATSGTIAEGNVGGGTGMVAHGFKGGTGTSSRVLLPRDGGFTVGVLVQANYGRRQNLHIAGVPVGMEIADLQPERGKLGDGSGSIIVVVGTDAPLLPHQLKRVVTRVALGVGIVGGRGENSSGDIFIAFSTANPGASKDSIATVKMLSNDRINRVFEATVQATEESIVNAMVAAETMEGVNGNKVYALPHDRLRDILRKYG